MFTGIIQSIGTIETLQTRGSDVRIVINVGKLEMDDVELGDSIAVSGVCLTVIEKLSAGFAADVSNETLSRTTLGDLKQGNTVNLEKAMTPSTRLGGHLVSGHVDDVGSVVKRWGDGRSERFIIRTPKALAKYIAEKGSICIDGISLTVNAVTDTTDGAEFELNIVPHTLQETTMDEFQEGRRVNLEVDIIARYLERLLTGGEASTGNSSGVTETLLAEHGFIK